MSFISAINLFARLFFTLNCSCPRHAAVRCCRGFCSRAQGLKCSPAFMKHVCRIKNKVKQNLALNIIHYRRFPLLRYRLSSPCSVQSFLSAVSARLRYCKQSLTRLTSPASSRIEVQLKLKRGIQCQASESSAAPQYHVFPVTRLKGPSFINQRDSPRVPDPKLRKPVTIQYVEFNLN